VLRRNVAQTGQTRSGAFLPPSRVVIHYLSLLYMSSSSMFACWVRGCMCTHVCHPSVMLHTKEGSVARLIGRPYPIATHIQSNPKEALFGEREQGKMHPSAISIIRYRGRVCTGQVSRILWSEEVILSSPRLRILAICYVECCSVTPSRTMLHRSDRICTLLRDGCTMRRCTLCRHQ